MGAQARLGRYPAPPGLQPLASRPPTSPAPRSTEPSRPYHQGVPPRAAPPPPAARTPPAALRALSKPVRRRAMSAASCRLPNGLCPGEREELLSQPLKPAPAVPFKSPYDLFRWEQQPLQPPGLSRQDREKRLGELPPYSSSPSPTLHSCHMCRRPALEGTPRDEES